MNNLLFHQNLSLHSLKQFVEAFLTSQELYLFINFFFSINLAFVVPFNKQFLKLSIDLHKNSNISN